MSNGGKCSARYLGGDLSVSAGACICPQPYQGEACESNPCNGVTCSGNGKCLSLGPNSYRCECNPPWVGEFCNQSCEGTCVGTFPYSCSLTETFSYCIKNTILGCVYQNLSNPDFCCLSNCYACEKVTCPTPDNDCFESSSCVNGVCLPFIQRLDGSICHSQSWGTCKSGQCVEGQAPTTLPSTQPTTQTTSQKTLTTSQQTQTTSQKTSQQTQTTSQQTQTSSHPSQTTSQQTQTSSHPSQTSTALKPNSTSVTHFTNETEYENNLSKIDNQLEPWKIGVIAAGSAIGVAIIVFALVVLLKPSIRSKVFVKQKQIN